MVGGVLGKGERRRKVGRSVADEIQDCDRWYRLTFLFLYFYSNFMTHEKLSKYYISDDFCHISSALQHKN